MNNLLQRLGDVRWHVAFRTYGNDHSTLVGLIVDWWISQAPGARWALEGGPSFGYNPKGTGGGLCDAILGEKLGEKDVSRGVLEVEGTRYYDTIKKMGKFFASDLADLKTLEFGLFLAYGYVVQGIGEQRGIHPLPIEQFVKVGKEITKSNPGKWLTILTLDKKWDRHYSGPRARNEYYMGSPMQVQGRLLFNGEVVATDIIVADSVKAARETDE